MINDTPPLILASQSPRRAQLLSEAGFSFEQRSPPFTDPDQPPGHLRGDEAEAYVVSLAEQKADSLATILEGPAVVLAADTICVDDNGRLVGKPRDRTHAEQMIHAFVDSEHRVITGVALRRVQARLQSEAHAVTACSSPGEKSDPLAQSFADTATVRFGSITAQQLDDYLATDGWRGKAGGYNLFDRQAQGWLIEVQGDPTTVVGLPMKRLIPMLEASLHSGG